MKNNLIILIFSGLFLFACQLKKASFNPKFMLSKVEKIKFNSFVVCNMAEVWVADTFRIFPGKYGEDPVWGYSLNLKYSDGKNAHEVFKNSDKEHIVEFQK